MSAAMLCDFCGSAVKVEPGEVMGPVPPAGWVRVHLRESFGEDRLQGHRGEGKRRDGEFCSGWCFARWAWAIFAPKPPEPESEPEGDPWQWALSRWITDDDLIPL